jgi:proteasome lid subunit RPN8/RPN11
MNYYREEIPKLPEILITLAAKKKLDAYIRSIDIEISGLGVVEKQNENTLVITDILLFKQECTSSETKLQSKDLSDFLVKLVEKGEDTSTIKLWWHSHHRLGCFWSSTDINTIGLFKKSDYFISIVGDSSQNYLCRLDIFKPLRITLEVPLKIIIPEDQILTRRIKKEVAKKVKKKEGYVKNE